MTNAISASISTSSHASAFVHKRWTTIPTSSVLGLPTMARKGRVVTSSTENKDYAKPKNIRPKVGMGVSVIATTMTGPALALVDERMSTEGTGLPFGLSNNLLGWILLGIFGLIWTFYFLYTSTLDEDEDSGLSL